MISYISFSVLSSLCCFLFSFLLFFFFIFVLKYNGKKMSHFMCIIVFFIIALVDDGSYHFSKFWFPYAQIHIPTWNAPNISDRSVLFLVYYGSTHTENDEVGDECVVLVNRFFATDCENSYFFKFVLYFFFLNIIKSFTDDTTIRWLFHSN